MKNPITPFRAWLFFSFFILVCGTVRIAPPDLAFYYSYAHSLLYDLDYCYANQYENFQFGYHETYRASQGLPANDWPIGTGICWLPFLIVSKSLLWLLSIAGLAAPPSGFSWFDRWFITLGSILAFNAGTVWLSYQLCRQYDLTKSQSLWAAGAIALGSSFTYHLYVNAADSHAPSAFFSALFLYEWNKRKNAPGQCDGLILGFILGLAGLIRPHNATIAIIPVLEWLAHPKMMRAARFFTQSAIASAIALLAYFPQLVLWKTLYGSWISVPRSNEVVWNQPHLHKMLFSDFHGMISWSPLFGLGLIGLMLNKKLWIPAAPVLLQIYIYSCNIAWWAGGSFGNRRMVGCAALFALGLAALIQRVDKIWLKGLVVLCGLWTYCLLLSEVGGTIELGHYMNWSEILSAIPAGIPSGIIRHFTLPEWGDHSAARIAGFAIVAGAGALACKARLRNMRFNAWLLLVPLALFNAWCAAAALNTSSNCADYDLSDYHPNDRFTWVIYYEKGFYLMRNLQTEPSLEALLAATMAEPRHPQGWTYSGWLLSEFGSDLMAYHYANKAFSTGQRMDEFLIFFDRVLTNMIASGAYRRDQLFNQRGVIRTVQGEYDLAKYDFQSSLTNNPDYTQSKENLALLEQWKQGNPARLYWE